MAWESAEALVARAPWDLVLAADVLYERRNLATLLALLPRLGTEVWLADPNRKHLPEFLADAEADGWEVRSTGAKGPPGVGLHRSPVTLELRPYPVRAGGRVLARTRLRGDGVAVRRLTSTRRLAYGAGTTAPGRRRLRPTLRPARLRSARGPAAPGSR